MILQRKNKVFSFAFLFILMMILQIFTAAMPSVYAASPQEQCEAGGGYWSDGNCKGKTEEERCALAGGSWDGGSKACDDSAMNSKQRACLGSSGVWNAGSCHTSGSSLTDFIKNIINTLLFLAGIMAVIVIVIAGLRFVTSNGDSSTVAKARNTIIYAAIGLVVAIMAYAIVNFVLSQI